MRFIPAVAIFVGASLAGCASAPAPAPSVASATPVASAAADVARVLDDWHDAAAHADEARYFAHFAPGGVFLGTDASERWDVTAFRAYAHPFFAKGKAWAFHATARHVTLGGSPGSEVAWFDETLATERLGPARGTGVLVRDGSGGPWRIALYDLSVPIPNERFDEVKKLIDAPH